MLIICSGPDTFRARQKARELTEAFRAKHDPSGFSIETMKAPDVADLLQRLSAPSFFSAKRFVRCDNLFEKIKIADVRLLAKRLAADKDQTIVVTVETEEPAAKMLGEFVDVQVFKYTHPLLTGRAFLDWCTKRAAELGASASDAEIIARNVEGNIWQAEQELAKRSANPNSPLAEMEDSSGSLFELVDAYFRGNSEWRYDVLRADDDQFLVTLFSQARSWARVKDGEVTGIHPYAVKKLSYLKGDADAALLKSLRAVVASRTSLAGTSETDTLL